MATDKIYEDMLYYGFEKRKEELTWLTQKFIESSNSDLNYVLDKIIHDKFECLHN